MRRVQQYWLVLMVISITGISCSSEFVPSPSATSQRIPGQNNDSGTYLTNPQASPQSAMDLGDPQVISHHWQALKAIKKTDIQNASHHVGHIIEQVSGEHRLQMVEVQSMLLEGRIHEAEHAIEVMLAGFADPELSMPRMHLELAQYSLTTSDPIDALHHLSHMLTGDNLDDPESIEQITEAILDNRIPAAMDAIEFLLASSIDTDLSVDCLDSTRVNPERVSLVAEVLADEAWLKPWGDQASYRQRSIVNTVTEALSEIGVSLEVHYRGAFVSEDPSSFADVVNAAQLTHKWDMDADLVVLLTGQHVPGASDGHYYHSSKTIVIEHDHDGHESEPLVLIHEIGHYLGLTHRAGTYMQQLGFPLVAMWSECQHEITIRP